METQSNLVLSQVLASTRLEKQLKFASELVGRPYLDAKTRLALEAQIERIQLRRADPNLYLAVVGEFNSGKSTFINGLLGHELLKTSVVQPTTAAITVIKGAPILDVAVVFEGAPEIFRFSNDQNQLWKKVQNFWPAAGQNEQKDLANFLHTVTAVDQVARHIQSVEIHHPTAFLTNDPIVLLDTPGTNAQIERHAQVTRNAIENQADAFVVVISAWAQLSLTFLNFLEEQLSPYLARCLFVVTQMDKIEPDEQTMVAASIRRKLNHYLQIEPQLYLSAPRVALNHWAGRSTDNPHLQTWATEFEDLKQAIIQRLCNARVGEIISKLERLLTQLLGQLEEQLETQYDQNQHQLNTLQKDAIREWQQFEAEQQAWIIRKIGLLKADSTTQIDNQINYYQTQIKDNVRQAILAATSRAALKVVVSTQLESLLTQNNNALNSSLQTVLQKFNNELLQLSRELDERFVKQYRRLQALNNQINVDSAELSVPMTTLNTSQIVVTLNTANIQFQSQENTRAGWGAAGGALVGTVILPIAGTLVGAIIGSVIGGFFGPSLETRKNELWDKAKVALDEFYSQLCSENVQRFDKQVSAAQAVLAQRLQTYSQHYRLTISDLIQTQQKQIQSLNQFQQLIQADLQALKNQ